MADDHWQDLCRRGLARLTTDQGASVLGTRHLSREEDDAVALVRVYGGLAAAQPAARRASTPPPLTVAVVDDAGRLLDVCEIGDEPAGYARLASLLAERSSGLTGVAIAADSDQ